MSLNLMPLTSWRQAMRSSGRLTYERHPAWHQQFTFQVRCYDSHLYVPPNEVSLGADQQNLRINFNEQPADR